MKALMILMTGLFLVSSAWADSPKSCPQNMAGKKFCVSGEMMLCNKEFDPASDAFRYEWHAVNRTGQTFDVFSPFYKKVDGYTPAPCSVMKSEAEHASKA